jgi:parallel beta-helix repeat protein
MRVRAILLLLALAAARTAAAATYYVATTGSDTSAGTSVAAPFKTIQHGVNIAAAGDTVYVRRGTYREDVEMNTGGTAALPIRVFAYPGEVPVIKGSDVVTGWVQQTPNVWMKTGWPYNSQQLFVDFDVQPAKSLQQIGNPSSYFGAWEYPTPVGSGRSTMVAGSFYYDASAATLYLWLKDGSNPNRHVIEASVRRRLFFMSRPYVYLKGFGFRHSNTSAFVQQGAAVELSSHSTIEDCDIEYMDFAGLELGYQQDGALAHNCNVSNNGDSGVNAVSTTNFLVAGVRMVGNNTRNFNPLWHAGGFKGDSNAYGTVRDSEVAFNNGCGIWFDYAGSGQPIVIRNNYIHDNSPGEGAVFFEVSSTGRIIDNVIAGNRRRGVYLAASRNTQVMNNTIVATAERAGIEVAGMPRGSATLTDNLVLNNIVSGGTSLYDLYVQPDSGSSIARNHSDYNDFYRASAPIGLWSGKLYTGLPSWLAATSNDFHSLNADPLLIATAPPSALSYAPAAGSSAIDAGTSLAGIVTDDYLYVPRPVGKAYDIGAFEAGAPSAPAVADAIAPVVTIATGVSIAVAGSYTISASATDNVGVTGMQLYLDGVLRASSSVGKISYVWTSVTAGQHEIKVTATDAARNTGTATGTVTVQ